MKDNLAFSSALLGAANASCQERVSKIPLQRIRVNRVLLSSNLSAAGFPALEKKLTEKLHPNKARTVYRVKRNLRNCILDKPRILCYACSGWR